VIWTWQGGANGWQYVSEGGGGAISRECGKQSTQGKCEMWHHATLASALRATAANAAANTAATT
jgi:hypothetical protein